MKMTYVLSLHQRIYNSEDLLSAYVSAGYPYTSILQFFHAFHGMDMCLRTLKNKLRRYGISRRLNAARVE